MTTEDPIITAIKSHLDNELNHIDNNMETPADEQFDTYVELYHNKIVFNESNKPVGLCFVKNINGNIKIDFQPLGPITTMNPLKLNNTVSDGTFYFLDQIPSPQ